MSSFLLPALAMLLAALLTACGGGGGDKTGDSIPKTYTASCSDGTTRSSPLSQADAQAKKLVSPDGCEHDRAGMTLPIDSTDFSDEE